MSTDRERIARAAVPSAASCATPVSEYSVTTVSPLPAPVCGVARVSGDKSISHRAVLFSAMAEGTSNVSGVLDSADVRSSLSAVAALGARVHVCEQPDGSLAGTIEGWGRCGPSQPAGAIDCGNSGTTVRLLMGLLAPWNVDVELTGDASLSRRPMKRITGPLSVMGARFQPEDRETLPLVVAGSGRQRPLVGISYDSPVASAQLKTALLLAGVFAEGETEVREPAPSRNHTELMLPEFGVKVRAHDCYAAVRGGQRMHAANVVVPGDPSSAAFPVCAAALVPGSDLTIEQVSVAPARIGFVRVLERMGAIITAENLAPAGREPIGSITIRYTRGLHGCDVQPDEIASMVDEIPVLALVAAHANGVTRFKGASELRVKETDRFAAIVEGLAKLGVRAWCEGSCDLCIEGRSGMKVPTGLEFDSLGDHRLAMTWALVGLTGNESVRIRDFEAVCVSYPQFLSDMERLAR
ncbi:3-phosphoshikimate 1-carboxyvinyltransferase [Adlercreutzia sp. ZJ138]|uniref:3-phosphoshikimate 1-carboxyvinyltransferase n=1 Tax=Adlercreutzia sp. ZJ138 TaxID=2709405 RepID=UPI0013EC9E44|nr:3-phosphoshikimate 1-carboxyvinyltransferase [Adlercreutzia sp. ZJ138]